MPTQSSQPMIEGLDLDHITTQTLIDDDDARSQFNSGVGAYDENITLDATWTDAKRAGWHYGKSYS